MAFEEIDALIEAGATLDDLEKFMNGGYSNEFIAQILAWHRGKNLIAAHQADISEKKRERERRKSASKGKRTTRTG